MFREEGEESRMRSVYQTMCFCLIWEPHVVLRAAGQGGLDSFLSCFEHISISTHTHTPLSTTVFSGFYLYVSAQSRITEQVMRECRAGAILLADYSTCIMGVKAFLCLHALLRHSHAYSKSQSCSLPLCVSEGANKTFASCGEAKSYLGCA